MLFQIPTSVSDDGKKEQYRDRNGSVLRVDTADRSFPPYTATHHISSTSPAAKSGTPTHRRPSEGWARQTQGSGKTGAQPKVSEDILSAVRQINRMCLTQSAGLLWPPFPVYASTPPAVLLKGIFSSRRCARGRG